MFAPVLFALIAPASPPAMPAVVASAQAPQQAVRVWLNRQDALYRGDKVRVYTRAGVDGYLMVLHVEPNGRVRVLFPLDPTDDNFVRGGQDYEIRGRGDREAFRVYDQSGAGTVFAALSPDPFRFEPVVLNGHWDYRAAAWRMTGDPEADLAGLAGELTGGARYDYDVQRYVVGSVLAYDDDWYRPSFYDPNYYGHSWYGRSGFSIRVGYGWGWRRWYDPWYWDPWYDPWWYGCWGPCYYGYAAFPYYYYPYYPVYVYPYRAPRRYVYVTSPVLVGGGYTFKSSTDRFGLAPDPIRPRRRTTAASSVGLSSPSRVGAAPSGRRTVGASSTPSESRVTEPRAAPGRRTVDRSSAPSSGSRTPVTRSTPERRGASPPASSPPSRSQPPSSRGTPTRRQLSRTDADAGQAPTVGERLDDGSWRLPTPPRRSAVPVTQEPQTEASPTGRLERRASTPNATPLGNERRTSFEPPRGLRVTDATPPARREVTSESPREGVSRFDGGAAPQADRAIPLRMTAPREIEDARPTPSRQPSASAGARRAAPSAGPAPRPSPTTRSAPAPSGRRPAAAPSRAPTRSAAPARGGSGSRRSSPPSRSSSKRKR